MAQLVKNVCIHLPPHFKWDSQGRRWCFDLIWVQTKTRHSWIVRSSFTSLILSCSFWIRYKNPRETMFFKLICGYILLQMESLAINVNKIEARSIKNNVEITPWVENKILLSPQRTTSKQIYSYLDKSFMCKLALCKSDNNLQVSKYLQ